MIRKSEEELRIQSRNRIIASRVREGFRNVSNNGIYLVIVMGVLLAMLITVIVFLLEAEKSTDFLDMLKYKIFAIGILMWTPVTELIILYFLGTPEHAVETDSMMQRISVKNRTGETPVLVRSYKDPYSKATIYEFESFGIPLSLYEDRVSEIEAALNVNVVKIEQGEKKSRVLVYAVDFAGMINNLKWQDARLPMYESMLLLGEGYSGRIIVDLDTIPHILIGGSTGSGKSVLLKSLIYQCAAKKMDVYVADFKGGIDYNGKWKELVNVVTDVDDLQKILKQMVSIIEERKKLFYEKNVTGISEYRIVSRDKCKRIVFACDEVAELLDKTGLSKEQKEKISYIESMMSTIARQGRAFGVNMILATQRPDANILSGQIKNNIDYRVCGRADDVLSKIVLDNTDASERIPKWEQGLFLNHEGELFRGYMFEESDICIYEGDYYD